MISQERFEVTTQMPRLFKNDQKQDKVMPLQEVTFSRDFDNEPDRDFERRAYIAIKRTIIEKEGLDIFDNINRPILLSSQPLQGGNQVNDMSVFFILPSVGGSGGTFYHYLALLHKDVDQFSLGLRVTTSENWKIYRDSFQGEHDSILIEDGQNITHGYQYFEEFRGYISGAG